jgi:hypothetical protein
MNRSSSPISAAQPALHRPHHLRSGGRRAGQGRRQPASAASVTLDAPKLAGTFGGAMGSTRILCSDIPTAVIFTLNQDSTRRLRRNHGVVASFSRALVEGLSAQQSDAEYNALLNASIQSIFEASNT